MSQVFHQQGQSFFPTTHANLAIVEKLPVGTYTVRHSKSAGFYLERGDDFELPAKLYGDVNKQATRILSTFLDREASTGVLLSGQKGAGKTMLTKRLSQMAAQLHGVSTLVVSEPFYGEEFNAFIANLSEPVLILIDEFEKMYDRDKQPQLLTLFDGLYSSKKLFLLTCNDRHRVDSNMQNRPGRLFYSIEFSGLPASFIEEYCRDKLVNQRHLAGVLSVAAFFNEFSFDMLQALVEEMNRYGESATDAMALLNMRPQDDSDGAYELAAFRDGAPIVSDGQSHTTISRSPLALTDLELVLYAFDPDESEVALPDGALLETETYRLNADNISKADLANGLFVFNTHDPDVVVHLVRRRPRERRINYDRFNA